MDTERTGAGVTGPRHYSLYLQDILGACEECLEFAAGVTFNEFIRDRKTMRAVERVLEIIGEASGKVPVSIRQSAPEIPWSLMIGMRIKLAHSFFNVEPYIVWEAARNDVPPLRQSIERLIAGQNA